MAATYIVTILFVSLVQSILPVAARLPEQASNQALLDTKATETLRALDTNGNGKVDRSEIAVFAKSQGLSTKEVLTDFEELDVNKDGELDSSEISGLLGDADAGQATQVHEEVEKPSTSNEVAAIAAAPKPAAPLVATPSLRPRSDKNTRVIATDATQSATGFAVAEDLAKTNVPEMTNELGETMSNMGLDLAALENDAQDQAGNVMASRLAQRAQVLLARSSTDDRNAERFDSEVRTLRGNATALAHQVNKETREAARKTVSDLAQKSLAKLKILQEQELEAQTAADDHRLQAAKAMERVRKAQASLRDN